MLKIIKLYNRYSKLAKGNYTRTVSIINLNTYDHEKYSLVDDNRKYQRKKWKNFDYCLNGSPFLFAVGLGIATCDAGHQNREEKRLFKAAQFGLTHEIKK